MDDRTRPDFETLRVLGLGLLALSRPTQKFHKNHNLHLIVPTLCLSLKRGWNGETLKFGSFAVPIGALLWLATHSPQLLGFLQTLDASKPKKLVGYAFDRNPKTAPPLRQTFRLLLTGIIRSSCPAAENGQARFAEVDPPEYCLPQVRELLATLVTDEANNTVFLVTCAALHRGVKLGNIDMNSEPKILVRYCSWNDVISAASTLLDSFGPGAIRERLKSLVQPNSSIGTAVEDAVGMYRESSHSKWLKSTNKSVAVDIKRLLKHACIYDESAASLSPVVPSLSDCLEAYHAIVKILAADAQLIGYASVCGTLGTLQELQEEMARLTEVQRLTREVQPPSTPVRVWVDSTECSSWPALSNIFKPHQGEGETISIKQLEIGLHCGAIRYSSGLNDELELLRVAPLPSQLEIDASASEASPIGVSTGEGLSAIVARSNLKNSRAFERGPGAVGPGQAAVPEPLGPALPGTSMATAEGNRASQAQSQAMPEPPIIPVFVDNDGRSKQQAQKRGATLQQAPPPSFAPRPGLMNAAGFTPSADENFGPYGFMAAAPMLPFAGMPNYGALSSPGFPPFPVDHGFWGTTGAGLQPAAGFGGPPTGRFGGPPATGFGHGGPTFHGSVGRIDASSGVVEQRPFPRTVARGAAAREEDTARLADRMMEMAFVGTNLTLRELPANVPEEEDAQGGGEEALDDDASERSMINLLPPFLHEAITRCLELRRAQDSKGDRKANALIEIVLDTGRPVVLQFLNGSQERLEQSADVVGTVLAIGNGLKKMRADRSINPFADDTPPARVVESCLTVDNRLGIPGTLHRISALRNRADDIIGLTCRVGRHIAGEGKLLLDIVAQMIPTKSASGAPGSSGASLLLLGPPGVVLRSALGAAGKTTLLREIIYMLANRFKLGAKVMVVDTSNEIGGWGDVPHPAIGDARRFSVKDRSRQHKELLEAVQNHTPSVVVVDEISTEEEADTIDAVGHRGAVMVATAHGNTIADLVKNPDLNCLLGGISEVTIGDKAAQKTVRNSKTKLERRAPPVFQFLVEVLSFNKLRLHSDVAKSVDLVLAGKEPQTQERFLKGGRMVTTFGGSLGVARPFPNSQAVGSKRGRDEEDMFAGSLPKLRKKFFG